MPNECVLNLRKAAPHAQATVRMIVANTAVSPEVITKPPPTTLSGKLADTPDIAEFTQAGNVFTVSLKPDAKVGQEQLLDIVATYTVGGTTAEIAGVIRIRVVRVN